MAKAPAAPKHPLDKFAEGPLEPVLAMLLWKGRMQNPELTVTVTQRDIEGLEACAGYLKISPKAVVYRAPGTPAVEAVPAMRGHPARPARPAGPPRDFVVVQLVDQNGDVFKPIENNEGDFDRSQTQDKVRRIREQAPQMAGMVRGMMQSGTFSNSELGDLCDAFEFLAKHG